MTERLYFTNTKTGKRYMVVSWNKETKEVVLQGEHVRFTETFDRDRFKAMGYTLEKGTSEDAE